MIPALRAECAALATAMRTVHPGDWSRPTGCPPWDVAGLLGHIDVTLGWLPGMLAAPQPIAAQISALQYYRPDDRFSPATSAERIALGRSRPPGRFEQTWQHVVALCEAEPPGRLVTTRHGDAMLLDDFLITRVVEVGVHGLDLAAALDRAPWLTPEAARLLSDLFGPDPVPGRDKVTFIRTATARLPLAEGEPPAPNSPFLGSS